jgi:hypothetical protein
MKLTVLFSLFFSFLLGMGQRAEAGSKLPVRGSHPLSVARLLQPAHIIHADPDLFYWTNSENDSSVLDDTDIEDEDVNTGMARRFRAPETICLSSFTIPASAILLAGSIKLPVVVHPYRAPRYITQRNLRI